MQVELKPGKYVVAISGGVDSVVLLDALRQLPRVLLVVAHVDHGMRPDSTQDQVLVAESAASYNLPFYGTALALGPDASEASARQARYQFLEKLRQEQGALAIVTAHHQDDAVETAIINLARGTGRRGLTALADGPTLRRPLLNVTKAEILAYAGRHNLRWREDSTNSDERYLRNHIRHQVLPRFSAADQQQFVGYITQLRQINHELDQALTEAVERLADGLEIDRSALQALPPSVTKELLTAWWRLNGFHNYETKTIIRAYQALRRGQSGTIVPLKKPYFMIVGRAELALHMTER